MKHRSIVLAVLLGVAAPAHADLEPAAKQRLDAALAAHAKGDFDTASKELEAAYAIDPAPALLYAWAQAKRLGGRCSEALGLYQRFLDTKPTEAQVAATKTGIELCEKELAKAPAPPPPPPSPPPRDDGPPAWYKDPIGGALTVGGAAGLGVGLGFVIASRRSEARARDARFRDDFGELLDEATTRRRIGLISMGVGAALLGGGIYIYATRTRAHGKVAVTTDGRSLLVAGTF
jgi:hypothetical protein